MLALVRDEPHQASPVIAVRLVLAQCVADDLPCEIVLLQRAVDGEPLEILEENPVDGVVVQLHHGKEHRELVLGKPPEDGLHHAVVRSKLVFGELVDEVTAHLRVDPVVSDALKGCVKRLRFYRTRVIAAFGKLGDGVVVVSGEADLEVPEDGGTGNLDDALEKTCVDRRAAVQDLADRY